VGNVAFGTTRTSGDVRWTVGIEGKADVRSMVSDMLASLSTISRVSSTIDC
jgi:hypothetical protein